MIKVFRAIVPVCAAAIGACSPSVSALYQTVRYNDSAVQVSASLKFAVVRVNFSDAISEPYTVAN